MADFLDLDSGPIGDLSGMPTKPLVIAARSQLRFVATRYDMVVPEICDYEVRRELLRPGAMRSVKRLDLLKSHYFYSPIITDVMLKAAEFWALLRREVLRRPIITLDADVILAAQATLLARPGDKVALVPTTPNIFHV